MKKLLSVLLCAAMLMSLGVSAAFAEIPENEIADLEEIAAAYVSCNAEEYARTVVETLAYDESLLSNALGYRSAGSDAEHAAADWLVSEMESLGLVEVEKIGVTVDLWQFNDASLTIEGTDIDIMPASYQVNGTPEEGITAEIVDCGTGFAFDYEGLDVEGKIVLIGVDQWNESWISGYMAEAYSHGAAAVVSYDIGGYGTYDDDQLQVQDVCQDDLLPTVAISYNHYLQIAAALEEGHNMATLKVDAVMIPEGGTSYDVCGRIKGSGGTDQQIIISGHYDVYFNGVQDDSAAIGVVLGIAKTMLDSGYQPVNDIVFMAHAAEEWGATGTEFDWTTGAWELINNVRPEWVEKTVAMINFELSAFYDGLPMTQISCVPEYANVVEALVNSGLLPETVNNIYPDGYDAVSVDSNTMEDGVSYRFAGVPYFINVPGTRPGEDGWIQMHYHTPSDDMSTYCADVMATNINTYGILAMVLDHAPAMMVDFTATCDDLAEAEAAELFDLAEADAEAYEAALAAFYAAAESYNSVIAAINADNDVESGAQLNVMTHTAFKQVQDELIGVIASSDVVIRHVGYQENILLLIGIINALENGELGNEEGTGALELAWMLNGAREYVAYIFSEETFINATESISQDYNEGNMFWGTDKGYKATDTYEATVSLLMKAETGDTDFSAEIEIYRAALEQQLALYAEVIANEIAAMQSLAAYLNDAAAQFAA